MKREIPVESLEMTQDTHRPMSPIEALMQAVPGDDPEASQLELLHLRDVLEDALEECLTPMELWVFNAVVVEGHSLRSLGRQISRPKTTIARIRDRALEKLQERLLRDPAIRRRLEAPK